MAVNKYFCRLPPVIVDLCLLVASLQKAETLRSIIPGTKLREFPLIKALVRDQALYFTGLVRQSPWNTF